MQASLPQRCAPSESWPTKVQDFVLKNFLVNAPCAAAGHRIEFDVMTLLPARKDAVSKSQIGSYARPHAQERTRRYQSRRASLSLPKLVGRVTPCAPDIGQCPARTE